MDNFKLIAITPETTFAQEVDYITHILDAGFNYVHIRKPGMNEEQVGELIESIPTQYYERLKLNDYFPLAVKYGLAGVHLNHRNPTGPGGFGGFGGKVSKSCHSVGELRNTDAFEYVFLSPVFDSISKKGYHANFTEDTLTGSVGSKVIALGGVTAERLPQVKAMGFGGAAFLGYLFNSSNLDELDAKLDLIKKQIICYNL